VECRDAILALAGTAAVLLGNVHVTLS